MSASIARTEVKKEVVRRILDTFQDAVIWVDVDSMIVQWNASAEAVFGFNRADVMGRSLVNTIIPDHHRQNHMAGMKNFMETGNGPLMGHTVEVDAMTWSGNTIPIAISIDKIVLNGLQYFTSHIRPLSEIPVKL